MRIYLLLARTLRVWQLPHLARPSNVCPFVHCAYAAHDLLLLLLLSFIASSYGVSRSLVLTAHTRALKSRGANEMSFLP